MILECSFIASSSFQIVVLQYLQGKLWKLLYILTHSCFGHLSLSLSLSLSLVDIFYVSKFYEVITRSFFTVLALSMLYLGLNECWCLCCCCFDDPIFSSWTLHLLCLERSPLSFFTGLVYSIRRCPPFAFSLKLLSSSWWGCRACMCVFCSISTDVASHLFWFSVSSCCGLSQVPPLSCSSHDLGLVVLPFHPCKVCLFLFLDLHSLFFLICLIHNSQNLLLYSSFVSYYFFSPY